jgi:ubiquinone/menaquinone biosynthesis C-methylase UbiE
MADQVPVPAGLVNRILDLAASTGQSTTALKRRFPRAEVWGIDAAAPMLRYAHKRAAEIGVEVHFAQRLAENTGFPDGSFDLIYAFLLFHELPLEVGAAVTREAFRLLRPGGIFAVLDNKTQSSPSPLTRYNGEFYRRSNGEPYSAAFNSSDFLAVLRSAGFRRVEDLPLPDALYLPYSMRIGEK